ncbi:hypothetical protein [Qipengyuania sp. ASV99]|uniref:hypothetical protein n=1 Tax=Qipengyuania sp. ASV99 TaxID=3399681 RepID=UPI003A4C817D
MFELLASEYRAVLQDVLAFAVCGAALLWGRGPERAIAVIWLILFEFAGRVYRSLVGTGYQLANVDWFLATTDVLAGAAFIAVALYANRNYPLWIAGMQVLAMTAHLARGMADSVSPVTYALMVAVPGWFQLIFLGIGVARHIARKRKCGAYRDWRFSQTPDNFSSASGRTGLAASAVGNLQTSWRDNLK